MNGTAIIVIIIIIWFEFVSDPYPRLETDGYLFGEHCDVFVERLGGADVTASDAGLPRRAGRQLALLEDEGQQWEQRMTATGTVTKTMQIQC